MASAIGLDIGSSAVRAVQLSTGRGETTIDRLGQVLLPPGAVREGEIIDIDPVVEALQLLWKQYKFKGKRVAVGIANQRVVVRQIELPAMAPADLAESLPFQVQEHIPIPVENAELDYEILDEYSNDDGSPMLRILLVAAASEMVESLLDVLSRAKLAPTNLDLDAFALLRAVSTPPVEENHDPTQGEMVINVGASVTNIVVHSGGIPRFVRILLMGGSSITDSLMSATGIGWDEAEAVKATADSAPGTASQIVAERSERFISEIRGSLDYYHAQADALQVQRVVITGGGALLPGLSVRIAQAVRRPVDRGHPMQSLKVGNVSLGPEQLEQAEPFLAVAIGLALGALE